MSHASDLKAERWKVFVQAREMYSEATLITDKLLQQQLHSGGSRQVPVSSILISSNASHSSWWTQTIRAIVVGVVKRPEAGCELLAFQRLPLALWELILRDVSKEISLGNFSLEEKGTEDETETEVESHREEAALMSTYLIAERTLDHVTLRSKLAAEECVAGAWALRCAAEYGVRMPLCRRVSALLAATVRFQKLQEWENAIETTLLAHERGLDICRRRIDLLKQLALCPGVFCFMNIEAKDGSKVEKEKKNDKNGKLTIHLQGLVTFALLLWKKKVLERAVRRAIHTGWLQINLKQNTVKPHQREAYLALAGELYTRMMQGRTAIEAWKASLRRDGKKEARRGKNGRQWHQPTPCSTAALGALRVAARAAPK